MKKYNFAFTLSEVLLVLGIIGVVSALTLPNLTQSTGDKEVITKVKKEYSSLDDAFGRAKAKYGSNITTWYRGKTTTADRSLIVGRRLAEFMNVDIDCAQTSNTQCFPAGNITNYNGSTQVTGPTALSSNTIFYKFKLKDGADIALRCIENSEYSLTKVNAYKRNPMCIVVMDIDGGKKGYNQYGRDIFLFSLTNDGISYRSYSIVALASCDGCKCGDAEICSTFVIKQNSMDYDDSTIGDLVKQELDANVSELQPGFIKL